MGGCRCSYRNCTSRSDGITHMFHYPVFDKVRCHQWLNNAHKLEFLNLTVSQLKNRVVCQHHFKDEHFMNFKKDKLTFDAVPTEDGPNCDSSQLPLKVEQDFGIILDDIENDYIDKKANFSVKYGNFLTNCDVMDQGNLNLTTVPCIEIDYKHKGVEEPSNIIINENIDRKLYSKTGDAQYQIFEHKIQQRNVKPSVVHLDFKEISTQPTNYNQLLTQQSDQFGVKILNEIPQESTPKNCSSDRKIKIISEQKVSEPVKLLGRLKPVSPTRVLPLPKREHDSKPIAIEPDNVKNALTEIAFGNIQQNNIEQTSNQPINTLSPTLTETIKPKTIKQPSPKSKKNLVKKPQKSLMSQSSHKSKLLNIISPERVAAIEQKRKFNMKLRDIIESCLDKIDDQEKINENAKYLQKLKSKEIQKQEVALDLPTEPKQGEDFKTLLTFFDKKMQLMENNLINRINQNSCKIMDLKNLLRPQKIKESKETKEIMHFETGGNEEVHKKYLFREISKYLSAEANNLIYEELFLNKYVQNVPEKSTAKRRKYR